jgi:hypothetical protein
MNFYNRCGAYLSPSSPVALASYAQPPPSRPAEKGVEGRVTSMLLTVAKVIVVFVIAYVVRSVVYEIIYSSQMIPYVIRPLAWHQTTVCEVEGK